MEQRAPQEISTTCPHCGEELTIELAEEDVTPNRESSDNSVRFYKLAEVGDRLHVSRATLKRWIYEGRMKAVKFGNASGCDPWHIPHSELERFIAERGGTTR